jgi:ABC-type multidrug transport system ATPase subunit
MIVAQLQRYLKNEIGADQITDEPSLSFAVAFCYLLARHLPGELTETIQARVVTAVTLQVDIPVPAVHRLIEKAAQPSAQLSTNEAQLLAFRARFGGEAENVLRLKVTESVTLPGFAATYGSNAALLLLDTLIEIHCDSEHDDASTTATLGQVSSGLNVDHKMFTALLRKRDARFATGDFSQVLPKRILTIGSAAKADIRLPNPSVASQHAKLVPVANGWEIFDLGSGRPTIHNGRAIRYSAILPNDTVRIGPYTIMLDKAGQEVTVFGNQSLFALSVDRLNRHIGDVSLLNDVSFTLFSGEVIALVGPSGAGKTTLLNAISGVIPADSGAVLLDGCPLHPLIRADPSLIGLVPQDDILHPELSVEETLQFAAKLRLPPNMGKQAIQERVTAVLNELHLTELTESRIGDREQRGISGGERKRVNLGTELLSLSTRVLFLDEPTSGLDPQTSADIATLVRQLADDGRIVFLVTHDVTSTVTAMVDHLMVLSPGGRLAWFGPPDEAQDYFGVQKVDQIFGVLSKQPLLTAQERYKEAPAYRRYVRTRQHLLGTAHTVNDTTESTRGGTNRAFSHYRTLTVRYALTKLRDHWGSLVLFGQAPILALAMTIVFPAPDVSMLFMLALSAFWFGASGSIRELITDRPIWLRERRVGVGPLANLMSKITVLGAIVALQCCTLTSIVWWGLEMGAPYNYNLAALAGMTTITGWVGMSLGLMISSLFRSGVAAVSSLPLWLIPQIAFGGLIVKVNNMTAAARLISDLMVTRYAFEGMIKCGGALSTPATRGLEAQSHPIGGDLYLLGFRTHHVEDMGLSLGSIIAVLFCFALFFLSVTLWQLHQKK